MFALLSPRLWLAVALAAFLAGTHLTAYRSGKAVVRAEWTADIAERTAAALAASEAARVKEKALSIQVEAVRGQYAKQTQNLHTVAAAAGVGLRDLQQALAGPAAAASATATARADDANRARVVVGACAKSVQSMAALLDEREQLVIGLQDYIRAIQPK